MQTCTYAQLGTDTTLYISRIVVENEQTTKKVEIKSPTNHIWIYDRSGSMTHLLPDLIEDLIKHVDTLQPEDTITLGWFSSEGKHNFMLKGARVGSEKENIRKVIRANGSPIALTCFSEILQETADQVINDVITTYGNRVALMFFTDGYPVVSNYHREIGSIEDACRRLRAQISSAIFVGYSEYYNRQVLGKMAEDAGGVLIHSSELSDFTDEMSMFISGSTLSQPRTVVNVDDDIVGHSVCIYEFDNMGVSVIQPRIDISTEKLNLLLKKTDNPVSEYWGIYKGGHPKGIKVALDTLTAGIYAGAVACLNANKADLALQLMSRIGDIKFIENINNAWSNEEFGNTASGMTRCINDITARFEEGQNKRYAPRANAFCVLDALDYLMDDEGAVFLPRNPLFKYNRIGAKTKTREGYPEFETELSPECPFSITWNRTQLNLSILCQINGWVDLGPDAESFGFSRRYPTHIFRNYTIVKNGRLNVSVLPMKISEETFQILQSGKMIDRKETYEIGKVYAVNFKKAPIVNRNLADKEVFASTFVDAIWQELEQMAFQKVANALLARFYPKDIRISDDMTKEQKDFLEFKGIIRGTFSPPVDQVPPTDFYTAKEFDVKIKSYSSLPSMDSVAVKISEAKPLTPSEDMMRKAYDYCGVWWDTKEKPSLKELEGLVAKARRNLRIVRDGLQRDKFIILSGKRWFSDLSEREGAVVKAHGTEFTFSIRDIEVEY
jgi:hypothetical protein